MSAMIERVTASLDAILNSGSSSRYDETSSKYLKELARAAIHAMCEPTKERVSAA